MNELEKSLFDERFLLSRPVLRALREAPAVLLVDEVDRADDEFEAFLLEVLSTYQVTIPEVGTVARRPPADRRPHLQPDARAARRPQAPLPLPLDRPPGPGARARHRPHAVRPHVAPALAEQVVRAHPAAARSATTCSSRRASPRRSTGPARCDALGAADLDIELAAATLGVAVKYREDADRVRASLDQMLRT